MQVGDLRWPWVAGVPETATLAEAAGLMRELKIGSAAVQRDRNIVGIVTEHDVLRAALDKTDFTQTPVIAYMSRDRRRSPSTPT